MPEPPPGASKPLFKGFWATMGGCQVGVKLFINICASVAFFGAGNPVMASDTDLPEPIPGSLGGLFRKQVVLERRRKWLV